MGPMSLTKDDKDKLIKYINFVATNARFKNLSTQQVIDYYGMLSFVQKILLPKLEANILEIEQIIEDKSEESKTEKGE
jgi:hypothetical protein